MTFPIRLPLVLAVLGWLGLVAAAPSVAQDEDADDARHHLTNEQVREAFDQLAEDHAGYVGVDALPGAAADEYVVTLTRKAGGGADARKPALLIVGSLDARELLPAEACLRIARQLVADDATKARLANAAIYLIPVANHRARALAFASPPHPVPGALMPFDNDHDNEADEDGPRDINGDGVISQMRVARPGGAYRVSEHDPRLLVKAASGETGTHDLFIEGVDDDGDGHINEDPRGTITLTTDWAIRWSDSHPGAGRFPMMRAETRAIAELLRQHPEIVAAVHLRSLGGALRVTTGEVPRGSDKYARDRETAKTLQELYKKLVHEKPAKDGAPDPGPGSFETWLHESQGAITLTAHLFAIPQPEKEKPGDGDDNDDGDDDDGDGENGDGNGDDGNGDAADGDAASADKPAAPTDAEKEQLAWLAYRPGDFRDWQSFVHPQLGAVEIGGWTLDGRHDPTPGDADEVIAKHAMFLAELLARFPRIEVARTEVESRGANLYRVRLTVHNPGRLDMRTDFAVSNHIGLVSPALFVTFHDTRDVEMISGTRRQKAGNLLAGGTVRFEWLVRAQSEDSRLVFSLETGITGSQRHVIDLDDCAPLRTDD